MDVDVLAKVRELQTEIGQGVDEAVLTDLLRAEGELEAYGFRFLRISGGFAVFEVPKQNARDWYREGGWPAAAKERIASRIAAKHHLELHEPPDVETVYGGEYRHHIVLDSSKDTLVVAHPRYLKIRISRRQGIPGPTLMEDLHSLYCEECTSHYSGGFRIKRLREVGLWHEPCKQD